MNKKMRNHLNLINKHYGHLYEEDIPYDVSALIIKALMNSDVYTDTDKGIITMQYAKNIVTVDYVLHNILD